jgi:hypothetical protein
MDDHNTLDLDKNLDNYRPHGMDNLDNLLHKDHMNLKNNYNLGCDDRLGYKMYHSCNLENYRNNSHSSLGHNTLDWLANMDFQRGIEQIDY